MKPLTALRDSSAFGSRFPLDIEARRFRLDVARRAKRLYRVTLDVDVTQARATLRYLLTPETPQARAAKALRIAAEARAARRFGAARDALASARFHRLAI